MPSAVFVDTWGWVALGHRRDPQHHVVRQFYQELKMGGGFVYTSDYVLTEMITLLYRREIFEEATHFVEGILEAAVKGHLVIEYVTSERFSVAWQLRKRYHDKPQISFTDLASIALMEELGLTSILTADEHFVQVGMGLQIVP